KTRYLGRGRLGLKRCKRHSRYLTDIVVISKIKSFKKVINTISHLKTIQVAYQLKNRFSQPGVLTDYLPKHAVAVRTFSLRALPSVASVLKVNGGNYIFSFLNQEKVFSNQVNWGEEGYGKLWNYNLQYV